MNHQQKNVLLVDDNKGILASLKQILESKGYNVDTAEKGQEAIQKATNTYFDLALLDMKLPDMEGTELLKILRDEVDLSRPTLPKMVKIMVTGHANVKNAIESLNLGADAFLTKPVGVQKLMTVVREKLGEEEKPQAKEEKVEKPEKEASNTGDVDKGDSDASDKKEERPLDSLMENAFSLLQEKK